MPSPEKPGQSQKIVLTGSTMPQINQGLEGEIKQALMLREALNSQTSSFEFDQPEDEHVRLQRKVLAGFLGGVNLLNAQHNNLEIINGATVNLLSPQSLADFLKATVPENVASYKELEPGIKRLNLGFNGRVGAFLSNVRLLDTTSAWNKVNSWTHSEVTGERGKILYHLDSTLD